MADNEGGIGDVVVSRGTTIVSVDLFKYSERGPL